MADPDKYAGKLNPAQKDAIREWIGTGYGDEEIKKKIDLARKRAEQLGEDAEYWPSLTRQAIAYYRAKWAEHFAVLEANQFELSAGTGLAKRQVLVRRASQRVGRIDHLIDQIEAQIDRWLDEGVLGGATYQPADPPDVLEAEWSVDGAPRGNKPARLHGVQLGDPTADPRYGRLIDLLNVLQKHYQAHEKYLALIAKLGGLGQKQADDADDTASKRRQRAEELFSLIRQPERERAGIAR